MNYQIRTTASWRLQASGALPKLKLVLKAAFSICLLAAAAPSMAQTTESVALSPDRGTGVPDIPALSISATNVTICSGDAVSFVATTRGAAGGNSFQWMINGVYVGTDRNNFTTSSLQNGDRVSCRAYFLQPDGKVLSVLSNSITVRVHPKPAVSAGGDQLVTAGDSVTLLATGGVSYSWSGGVRNGDRFVPERSGWYTVTGIDANGCESSDDVLVTVLEQKELKTGLNTNNNNRAAGREEPAAIPGSEGMIKADACNNTAGAPKKAEKSKYPASYTGDHAVYPNPSRDVFYVRTTERVKAVVRDLQGKVVTEVNDIRESHLILPVPGVYLLQLFNAEGRLVLHEKLCKY